MLNAFLATGKALLRHRLPAASEVIIYTVSLPIENLQIPTNPAKDAEKWCREFRDLPSSFSHCTDKPFSRFRHRAQQYSRQKKIAFSIPGFSTHTTNIFSSAAKICSVLAVRAENAPEKHFLSALHTAVFPAAFSCRYS